VKKSIRKAVVLLTLAVMFLTTVLTASAENGIIYDGNAEDFIFVTGSEEEVVDLFHGFQDIMPGDQLTEKVTIRNASSNDFDVKIYIRSLGATEEDEAFISQLHLSVALDANNPDTRLYHGQAHETGDLAEWILLGELEPGGEVNLDVTITVPITLDNEFADTMGHMVWQVKVEEFEHNHDNSTEDAGDDAGDNAGNSENGSQSATGSSSANNTKTSGGASPKTGDSAQLTLYCGLLGMSLGVVLLLAVLVGKKRKAQ
jgi:hypothetical protein